MLRNPSLQFFVSLFAAPIFGIFGMALSSLDPVAGPAGWLLAFLLLSLAAGASYRHERAQLPRGSWTRWLGRRPLMTRYLVGVAMVRAFALAGVLASLLLVVAVLTARLPESLRPAVLGAAGIVFGLAVLWKVRSVVRARRVGKTGCAAVQASIRRRLEPESSFRGWASERWAHWQTVGPLGITPARRTFAPKLWRGELDVHALLYPPEPFVDAADFFLFVRYTSSIQQFLARGVDFDPRDWFVPGVKEQQVDAALAALTELPEPLDGARARHLVDGWNLPETFDWVARLRVRAAWVRQQRDGLELTAVAEEGYLSFFVLRF